MTDSPNTTSSFRKPGFIVAAVVIGLLAVLGVVLGIRALVVPAEPTAEPTTAPTVEPSTAAPSPSTDPTEPADDDASICGLDAVSMDGRVSKAPSTEWVYDGAGSVALPTSSEYGPGVSDGFASCFARTPEGAVFAGGVTVVQSASLRGTAREEWADYLISDGPQREKLIADSAADPDSTSDIEVSISGFRLLAYDGDTALVNIAATGRGEGEQVVLSTTYALVWAGGDWHLDASQSSPAASALVPDLGGFTRWGE